MPMSIGGEMVTTLIGLAQPGLHVAAPCTMADKSLRQVVAALKADAGWVRVGECEAQCALPPELHSLLAAADAPTSPLVIADAAEQPADATCSALMNAGFRALVLVSSAPRQRGRGTLAVLQRSPRAWSEAEVLFAIGAAVALSAAIAGARLLQSEQESRREATALLGIARAASSTLELDEVLERVVGETARLTGADRCSIWLLDQSRDVLLPAALYGMDDEFVSRWKTIPLKLEDELLSREALLTGRTVIVADAETDPRTDKGAVRMFEDKSILVVPLWGRDGRGLGTLFLNYIRHPHPFTAREVEVAESIAAQAAMAIENARLYSAAREQHLNEQSSLLGLSGRLTATLDLQERLEAAVEIAARALEAEVALVALLDQESDTLTVRAAYGLDGPWLGRELPQEPTIIAREPVTIPDLRQLCTPLAALLSQAGIGALLSVPLTVKDEPLGAMLVGARHTRTFELDDVRFCRLIANQTAIAVHNAVLYSQERRARQEVGALYRVAQSLASATDVETVAQVVVQAALSVTGLAHCRVLLCDKGHFEYATCPRRLTVTADNARGADVGQEYVPCDAGSLLCQAFSARGATVLHGGQIEMLGIRAEYTSAVLVAPMTAPGGAVGLLCLDDAGQPHHFTERELRLAQALADHAALAVERARLYEELQRELEVKTALLHELQHRVKNSLQMVAGFLSYHLAHADEVSLREVVSATMSRIKGIAAAHEALSRQAGERVRLRSLLRAVLAAIPSPPAAPTRPRVEIAGPAIMTSADRAITIALVVHELVSNAFRHGTSAGDPLTVTVGIQVAEQEVQIVVQDDGHGLPPDFQWPEGCHLGLTLVDMLVRRELEGEFSLIGLERGTRATIRMPLRPDDLIKETR